jgi:hypothetical protein
VMTAGGGKPPLKTPDNNNFSRLQKTTATNTKTMSDKTSINSAEDRAELILLSRQIADWREQQSPRVGDREMETRFPGLGSVRSLNRFAAGDLEKVTEEKLPSWVQAYRGIAAMIEGDSGGEENDPLYSDISGAAKVKTALSKMLAQRHPRQRVLVIEGDTGAGKTSAMKVAEMAAQRAKAPVAFVTGNVTWESSVGAMLADILTAVSEVKLEPDKAHSKRSLWLKLVASLGKRRLVVFIDEGHRMTGDGSGFNAIIDLVNVTQCFFVIGAVQTIWGRMMGNRWREAKQLAYNRTDDTILLGCPGPGDVKTFLKKRCYPEIAEELKADQINRVVEACGSNGHYAFLRRVALELGQGKPEDGPAAWDRVKAALEAAQGRITRSRR